MPLHFIPDMLQPSHLTHRYVPFTHSLNRNLLKYCLTHLPMSSRSTSEIEAFQQWEILMISSLNPITLHAITVWRHRTCKPSPHARNTFTCLGWGIVDCWALLLVGFFLVKSCNKKFKPMEVARCSKFRCKLYTKPTLS